MADEQTQGNTADAAGNNSGAPGATEDQSTAQAGGDGSQAQANAGEDTASARFTQLDMDALAAKVRDEEKRKAEKRISDAQAAADRRKAEEQGEFKRLYEAEQQRTQELETRANLVEPLQTHVNQTLDGELADWPSEVRALDPGAENVVARLEWVNKTRALAKRLIALSQSPNGEHGQRRTGAPAPEAAKQQLRQDGAYRT